jgi:hypothetical protein
MGVWCSQNTKLHEPTKIHLQITQTHRPTMETKLFRRNKMNDETITIAARISLHDYQVLQAQVAAGNFKRMSDAIRACVRYTVTQLEKAPDND